MSTHTQFRIADSDGIDTTADTERAARASARGCRVMSVTRQRVET
jgi:hypothetical protein